MPTIGQLRYLTLQLQGGTGFALGATTQSTVTIEENDADWQGVLQTANGILGFTLSLRADQRPGPGPDSRAPAQASSRPMPWRNST